MKNLNKYLVGAALIIVFGAYALYSKMHSTSQYVAVDAQSTDVSATLADNTSAASNSSAGNDTTNSGSAVPSSSGSNGTNRTSKTSATGAYKDGTYTGPITDAFYGNYQVAAVIANGKLTDVKFLQYPNDRRNSVQINQAAMPMLKSEAITSQSSNVNTISGATQSSHAFRESLAAALAQAKS